VVSGETLKRTSDSPSFLLGRCDLQGWWIQKPTKRLIMQNQLITENEDLLVFQTELFTIEVLGGIKYSQLDALRTTLKISKENQRSIRHSVNLYNSKALENLLQLISDRFSYEPKEIDYVLADLVEQLEAFRLSKLNYLSQPEKEVKELTDKEVKTARKFLKAEGLMELTGVEIGKSGIVGEEINRFLMLMVFTSRKLKRPLNIISLSPSGSGKTYLQEKVSELIPEEDKIEITSLSKNAFYYLKDIDKKLILIEDLTGAESSLYPIREIQSKGKLTKSVTQKDAKGNNRTTHHVLEGRVCVSSTGTKESVYADNESRSIIIHIDESKIQDEKIIDYQSKLASGKINFEEENKIKELFQNCQRILKPIEIRNPFAEALKLPKEVSKIRRTFSIYLGMIEVICFYHQYQRPVKTDSGSGVKYIEVSPEDIKWANKLLKDVILTKSDELNSATRKFYEKVKIHLLASEKESFGTKEVRTALLIPNATVKRYIKTLVDYEYLKILSGSKHKGYAYGLVEDESYSDLNDKITTVLQEQLNYINGSVAH
jgi:hypothetical protein